MPTGQSRDGPWVLVSGPGQSRAGVAAVRSLAAAGYHPAVTVSGPSLAAASRFCERRVAVPPVDKDEAGYVRAVRDELARGAYLTVLAGSDAAAMALDAPGARFLDKLYVRQRAAEAGIEMPSTLVFESHQALVGAAEELPYPVIVKPTVKRFLAQRVDRPADLSRVPDDPGGLIVQPFLDEPLHGVLGLTWQGSLIAATHFRYLRVWPKPAGTVAAAITTAPDDDLDARLERILADHDGPFHVDLAGPFLLDLNPRIHAALPLAAAAGAEVVATYCRLLEGGTAQRTRGRSGVGFRWIEGNLRSVIYDARRGRLSAIEALRALLPSQATVHGHESVRDPGPFLARLRFVREDWQLRNARRAATRRRLATLANQRSDRGEPTASG